MRPAVAIALLTLAAAYGAASAEELTSPASASLAQANKPLIAFQRKIEPAPTQIYIMKADGTNQRHLAEGWDLSWSPDGRRIALINEGIDVMNVDGTGLRSLVAHAECCGFDWSPDGRRIAFVERRGIRVANTDGTRSDRLTSGFDSSPRWSPNGRKLLFTRTVSEGGNDVFVVNADGSGLRRLTHGFFLNLGASASWSPDSRRLAIAGQGSGTDDVFVMNADGSDQQNLTHTPGISEDSARWSPTGTSIVFTSGHKWRNARAIHTIRPDGRRHRNLAQGTQPSWGAAGQSIVFTRAKGSRSDIYVMGLTGRNATNLSKSPAGSRSFSPAWSPRS